MVDISINTVFPNHPTPARTLGDYQLIEELGRGGMGIVWKARQIRLGRLVALKLLRDSHLASPTARERFRVEAEAAGRLHHPNIVPIYEFGMTEGNPFIIMPLVEGPDLAHWLRGTPMDAQPLGRLMAKLAHAIHFAHQRGILHLDLKPANVLVDGQGEPHVTDFGLAKRLDAEAAAAVSSQIIGSPNYMAPEQIAGQTDEITTAADVYSLGAIMYELLTGRAPFRAESPLATLRQVREEEPLAPRRLYRFADPELETICLKCLEKHPDHRYTSARALAADLERWLNHEPIQARPATLRHRVSKWVGRNPVIATLLVLLHLTLALGLGGIIWMGARAAARARESQDRLLHMYVEHGNQLLEAHEDFSALLWFVEALRLDKADPAREDIHRYRIQAVLRHASMLRQAVFRPDHLRAANFDPAGRRLAIGTTTGVAQVLEVASGLPVTPELKLAAPVHRVRFSPDGTKLLAMDITGESRIWDAATGVPITPVFRGQDYTGNARVWDTASGGPVIPVLPGADHDEDRLDWAVLKLDPSAWFSPDGRMVLTAWGCKSAHLWDAASGRHLRAFSHSALVVCAKFSPDGSRVATGGKDNTARVWETQTGQAMSPPLVHDHFVAWAGFSPDGRRLLTVSNRRLIHVWDWRAGKELLAPLSHGDALFAAAFSPDGQRILSAGWDKTVRIWDAATGLQVGRFDLPGGVVSAAWSPDGRTIATACTDGIARLWEATGTARLLASLPHGSGDFYLSFSADSGRLLTFGFDGTARVWGLAQPDASQLQLVHPRSVWAAFNSDATKVVSAAFWPANDVRVFDAHSGAPASPILQHAGSVRRARFSPDNLRLVTASDDGTARIWDALSGRELTPALRHSSGVSDAVFSPDAQTVATASNDGAGRLWDAATGRLIATLPHSAKVGVIVFSPNGRWVATASDDSTARVWDSTSGQPATPPLVHAAAVNSIRFSRDSSRLLTGCDAPDNGQGLAQVWEVTSAKPIGQALTHASDVNDAEFSPEERFIVTASQDHTARIWDALTHAPLTPPMRALDAVLEARFTPDGHRVVTLTSAGDVRLWDARTGEAITASLPHPHGYDMGHAAFSPDGRRLLLSVGGDGPVLQEFTPTREPIPALLNQAEVLSGHRLDAASGIVSLDSATLAQDWKEFARHAKVAP